MATGALTTSTRGGRPELATRIEVNSAMAPILKPNVFRAPAPGEASRLGAHGWCQSFAVSAGPTVYRLSANLVINRH